MSTTGEIASAIGSAAIARASEPSSRGAIGVASAGTGLMSAKFIVVDSGCGTAALNGPDYELIKGIVIEFFNAP